MSRVLTEVKWGAPLKHVLLHLQTTTLHKCRMMKPQRWNQKANGHFKINFCFLPLQGFIYHHHRRIWRIFVEYTLFFSEEDNWDIIHPIRINLILHILSHILWAGATFPTSPVNFDTNNFEPKFLVNWWELSIFKEEYQFHTLWFWWNV